MEKQQIMTYIRQALATGQAENKKHLEFPLWQGFQDATLRKLILNLHGSIEMGYRLKTDGKHISADSLECGNMLIKNGGYQIWTKRPLVWKDSTTMILNAPDGIFVKKPPQNLGLCLVDGVWSELASCIAAPPQKYLLAEYDDGCFQQPYTEEGLNNLLSQVNSVWGATLYEVMFCNNRLFFVNQGHLDREKNFQNLNAAPQLQEWFPSEWTLSDMPSFDKGDDLPFHDDEIEREENRFKQCRNTLFAIREIFQKHLDDFMMLPTSEEWQMYLCPEFVPGNAALNQFFQENLLGKEYEILFPFPLTKEFCLKVSHFLMEEYSWENLCQIISIPADFNYTETEIKPLPFDFGNFPF